MKVQADINARAAASGATLGAMWESMTGTFTNFLAVVGESFSGEMKGLTEFFSSTSEWLSEMAKEYPMFSKLVGFIAIGIPVVTGVLGTLGIAIGAVTMTMGVLGITSMATFGWIVLGVVAIAGIATLIISNWGPIKGFFIGIWDGIKSAGSSAWEFMKTIFSWTPLGLIINNWTPIVGVFKSIIGMVTKPFSEFFTWIESKFNTVSSGLNSIGSFFGISGPAPTPSKPSGNPRVASARAAVSQKSGASNTVNVNISNPNFTSKEHAAATQKQIDEQVRKSMQKQANDKKDRSYS
jgi:phage-related protein